MIRFINNDTASFKLTNQNGMSMVEFMVAITVGSLLTVGLTQIFLGNKKAYNLNNEFTLLQENGRYALDRIGLGVLMADHWGVMNATDIGKQMQAAAGTKAAITGIGNCNGDWILQTASSNGEIAAAGIMGYEGESTISDVQTNSGFPTGCIPASEYVAGSDILVVRYADSTRVVAKSDLGSTANPNNANTVFIRGGMQNINKVIFPFTEVKLGSEVGNLSTPDIDGVFNYPYAIEV